MIRRPPRSTLDRSAAASDVYKRQDSIRALMKVRAAKEGLRVELELLEADEMR